MRPTRTVLTLAALAALALPASASAEELTPLAAETPAAIPAGSCANPSGVVTDPAVRYRWVTRTNAWRVRPALSSVRTTSRPGAGGVNGTLTQNTMHTGVQAWYLVLDARQVGTRCFLRLRLPSEPTSRGGWADRDLLVTQRQAWQIEVDLSDRRVRTYRSGRRVLDRSVVIGAAETPTPTTTMGEPFAMYDAKRGAAADFTGTWQLATTARSSVDPDLGRIGIHGRGGASLTQALGTAASHGCVRADNATVDAIVRSMGLHGLLGVPVVISA